MNKSISIAEFKEARDYMEGIVKDRLNNLEIGIYDPWLKFIFEKDLKNSILQQFNEKYPELHIYFNFNIYLSAQIIEFSVQKFYHPFSTHKYLGCIKDPKRSKRQSEAFLVDCYYSNLYETFGEPRILIRYGDARKEMDEGAMSAAEQFYQGLDTAMAKGYQLALEAGYIRQ